MRFSYYSSLSKKNKAIYLQSEAINEVELEGYIPIMRCLQGINKALSNDDKIRVQLLTQKLINNLCECLEVKEVKVKVLSCRPSNRYGELHGIYEPSFSRARPALSIWMKTSAKKQTVKFKTFIRTLIHEFCHHLDYELYGFKDSFHTIGFFNRESSLYKQVMEYMP
jgi:hypothetical protein